MRPSNRILINTLAQYVRTIINMVLSLYSSRLVLNILGVEDYGIYALVAVVVSMLSFLTNSLVGSTQRFLSVSQGIGDKERLKGVFSNSLILHLVLGLIITMILEGCSSFLFNGFLNIPSERISIASVLYQQVIWMVYISFIASPFRALLISHENIIYTSIVDVLDGGLKVILVLGLPFVSIDKLLAYGWIMFSIQTVNLLAFAAYCYIKYEECVIPQFQYFSWLYVRKLSAYTGWVVYSAAVIAIRNQGIAIVLNKFFGSVLNAAYGIGNQIAGMVAFISTSFTNAISPQLMAAEGAGNREKMWRLAELQSKFSFLLLAMLAVPTLLEMKTLILIWLGQIPNYAAMFACMFITMQTLDQLSLGLEMVNRAMGDIGKYTMITFTPKLLNLPLGWLFLKMELPVISIVLLLISIEYFCMLLRIVLMRRYQGFNVRAYCNNVLLRTIYPVAVTSVICYILTIMMDFPLRFLITYAVSIPVFAFVTYSFALSTEEKDQIKGVISSLGNRISLKYQQWLLLK